MLLEENLMSSIKKKEIKEKENSKELIENKLVNCFEIVILTNEREWKDVMEFNSQMSQWLDFA